MITFTKKICLQTSLLALAIISTWLFGWAYISRNILFSAGVDFSYFAAYQFLTLFIFFPVTVLYFIRKKSSVVLGKLFRATAYFSVLVSVTLFLVNFPPTVDFVRVPFVESDGQYYRQDSLWDLSASIVFLSLAAIFYILARINISLSMDVKFSLFPRNKNRKLFLSALSIAIVLAFSVYLLYKASSWASRVESNYSWYPNPEILRIAVKDMYDMMFKKILLLGSLVFISTLLLLKVLPNHKTD